MPSPLRKQRDDERKTRMREALLDAAGRVFVNRGYHYTLISDIASEAGVGQGTFYRHFKSKREVFEAIVDRFIGTLLRPFEAMSVQIPTDVTEYRDASLRAVNQVADVLDANRDIARMFLREATAIDHAFEEKISGFYDRFAALARFYLDHAIAHGFARPCHSGVVSQALVGTGLRLIDSWWRGAFPDLSVTDVIREIVDLAFFGFGPVGAPIAPGD
jgi:AcrR family transcriptional regulator